MARPDPLVRNVLPEDVAVVMTVAPDPLAVPVAAAAGELLAGELLAGVEVLLLPLEQAAASTATPTMPPTPVASLAGAGIRLTIEFLIMMFFFHLALPAGSTSASPNGCRYRYGAKREHGLPVH